MRSAQNELYFVSSKTSVFIGFLHLKSYSPYPQPVQRRRGVPHQPTTLPRLADRGKGRPDLDCFGARAV